jgi:hypothetical protein
MLGSTLNWRLCSIILQRFRVGQSYSPGGNEMRSRGDQLFWKKHFDFDTGDA